ncbi:MAG: ABC transporter permease [Chloroflexi bacterium]|nr:ABC transporter permease [Chloroflexota bacterium]
MRRTAFWARFASETALAIGAAGLALLTAVDLEWIETIFGIDPDAGQGWLEAALTVALAGAALASALFARRDWRRRPIPAPGG